MALLAVMLPAPEALAATATAPPIISVAPTCVTLGATTRMVIYGQGWALSPVTLSRVNSAGVVTALGTAMPRLSPVRQQPGSFSFTATVTGDAPFQITATQVGAQARPASVAVTSGCLSMSVNPPCLSGPGAVQVSGAGFVAGPVSIDVDPFGDAETASSMSATAGKDGNFTATVDVPFRGATVPIVATGVGTVVSASRGVAFVDPCPPPPPPTTTTTGTTSTTRTTVTTTVTTGTTRTTGTTGTTGTTATTTPTSGTSTTVASTTSTTTVVTPPVVPPVTVPTPGSTAQVSISPNTIRPGRCSVVVFAAAPALAVIARFADGPPVNGQTGSDGRAVLSICEPYDSGARLGPLNVLIGIGSLPPAPVFSVLRVPRRPQPPLLESGADSRRS